MNGAVEAANKNNKKIIEKMTVNYKDWHEMLPYALLAYQTSIRTSTEATPYSLVYGMEAVLPIEWAKQRYEQLNLIDEKRLKALCHGQCYQQRMARAFNAKIFSEGAVILNDMDGTENALPVNADSIKKYYP
ncbi:hypothetical protein CRG98_030188 [Punica granatum]|uniref:Integrase catalytic domain-containing protein n=1 Tax=Punica granatum TaxID=22663 RepID=A0A2I0IZI8_PUNGR|nr:hypothetical protein CRG98_030188 [Punica granatum]